MVVVQGVVEVKTDSFISTVVVTLSVNMMCIHICTIVVRGVCILKCCTTQTYYSIYVCARAHVCVCVCIYVSTCMDMSGWMCL